MDIFEFDRLHNLALKLANYYHKNMTDKGGNPYIEHLIFVSMHCQTKEGKIGALLHDIIEDTDCTVDILLSQGIPKNIVDVIEIISRKKDESYSEFIDRIVDSNNVIALEIKYADLINNMDLSRLSAIGEKDVKRVKTRYIPAYNKIKEKLLHLTNNCTFYKSMF